MDSMGGVAVLQPQNLFNNNHGRPYNRLTKSGPAVARSTNRRKRSPPKNSPAAPKDKKTILPPSTNHRNTTKPGPTTTDHLVVGQVKILKRGEILPTKEVKQTEKVGATSAATRLGQPEARNIRISDFYAGSAFVTSPEPSSLPVPVFFKKKGGDVIRSIDCDATSDLRKLLGLNLS